MDYTDSDQGQYDLMANEHSEQIAMESKSLDRLHCFEKWARDAVLKFGTKEQLEWTEDKYVLLALQIVPGLITKFEEDYGKRP